MRRTAVLALAVFGAAQVVPFGAAFVASRSAECQMFRNEGDCPAARRTQWVTGALGVLALGGAWGLGRRRKA